MAPAATFLARKMQRNVWRLGLQRLPDSSAELRMESQKKEQR